MTKSPIRKKTANRSTGRQDWKLEKRTTKITELKQHDPQPDSRHQNSQPGRNHPGQTPWQAAKPQSHLRQPAPWRKTSQPHQNINRARKRPRDRSGAEQVTGQPNRNSQTVSTRHRASDMVERRRVNFGSLNWQRTTMAEDHSRSHIHLGQRPQPDNPHIPVVASDGGPGWGTQAENNTVSARA